MAPDVPAPARSSPAATALSVRPLLPVPAEPAPTFPKRRQAAAGGHGWPSSKCAGSCSYHIYFLLHDTQNPGCRDRRHLRKAGAPDSRRRSAFPKLIRFCTAAGGSGTTRYRQLLALPQAQLMPTLPSSSSRERRQLAREYFTLSSIPAGTALSALNATKRLRLGEASPTAFQPKEPRERGVASAELLHGSSVLPAASEGPAGQGRGRARNR